MKIENCSCQFCVFKVRQYNIFQNFICWLIFFLFVIQEDVPRDEIGVFRHSSSDKEQHHHTPTNHRQQAEENP